jgi:murein DD-endopeptidase MepM/ murein hydrolase activator NlpD
MCDLTPSSSGSERPAARLTRRRALLAFAATAGALALGDLGDSGSSPVSAATGPLDGPGSALKTAKRLGVEPRRVPPPPPPGKLIFPVEIPATSNIYVLDNFGDCRGHEGIDILAARGGNPIFAVADGVLTNWYTNTGTAGFGWTLFVAETNVTYKYFHLADDQNGLIVGSRVRLGDVLGFVGSSGTSSPDNFHLHFEVRPNKIPVDPLPLLDIPDDILIGPPDPSCR